MPLSEAECQTRMSVSARHLPPPRPRRDANTPDVFPELTTCPPTFLSLSLASISSTDKNGIIMIWAVLIILKQPKTTTQHSALKYPPVSSNCCWLPVATTYENRQTSTTDAVGEPAEGTGRALRRTGSQGGPCLQACRQGCPPSGVHLTYSVGAYSPSQACGARAAAPARARPLASGAEGCPCA